MHDILGRTARHALGESRKCMATTRQGLQCGRASIPGGFVCNLHGGNAPLTKRAAEQRLLSMVDPAIDVLFDAMRTGPPCEKCGRTDAMRDPVTVRAAQLVLDRAGFRPVLTLQTVVVDPNAWMQLVTDEQLQQMKRWIEEALAPRVLVLALPAGAEDGELLVDSPSGTETEGADGLNLTDANPQEENDLE